MIWRCCMLHSLWLKHTHTAHVQGDLHFGESITLFFLLSFLHTCRCRYWYCCFSKWSVSSSVPHRYLLFFLQLYFCIWKSFAFCHRHQNQPCLWTILLSFFPSVSLVFMALSQFRIFFFSLWFLIFFSSSAWNSICCKQKK